jgi:hypothetical protein
MWSSKKCQMVRLNISLKIWTLLEGVVGIFVRIICQHGYRILLKSMVLGLLFEVSSGQVRDAINCTSTDCL